MSDANFVPQEVRRYFSRLGKKGGAKGGRARMAQLTREQRQELGRAGGLKTADQRKRKTALAVMREMFASIKATGQRYYLWEDGNRRGYIEMYPTDANGKAILKRLMDEEAIIGNYGPGSTKAECMEDYLERSS